MLLCMGGEMGWESASLHRQSLGHLSTSQGSAEKYGVHRNRGSSVRKSQFMGLYTWPNRKDP